MNRIIIVLTLTLSFLIFISCHAEKETVQDNNKSAELNWLVNLDEAVNAAGMTNKPIFVNFTGSDWCGWCKRLQAEVFSQPEFIEYAQGNLIMLRLDFPKYIQQSEETRQYNGDLLEKFGVQGFPTIILLDQEGKEIKRTGYQPGGAESYVKHIQSLLIK